MNICKFNVMIYSDGQLLYLEKHPYGGGYFMSFGRSIVAWASAVLRADGEHRLRTISSHRDERGDMHF